MMRGWIGWTLLLAATLPGAAWAQVSVRAGDHPGFGRVVFDFAAPTGFDLVEDGGRVLVVFEGGPALGAAPPPPRNVRSIRAAEGSATLILIPGARVRSARMGNRVVLDVRDPAPDRPARVAARAAPRAPPPALPEPAPAPVAAAPPAALAAADPVSVAADAHALPLVPVEQKALPGALPPPVPAPLAPVPTAPVAMAELPAPIRRPAGVLMVADPGVGAASFRRGDRGLVVFDARAVGSQPDWPDATVQEGQDSTALSVPLAPGEALVLRRAAAGWQITVADGPAASPGIALTAAPDGLRMAMERPGRVVTIVDPVTGQAFLVGTANPAAGSGPGNQAVRRAPAYAIVPTWQGVAVEPYSDQVDLRPTTTGFVLKGPALSPVADAVIATAGPFTRRYDFAAQPVPALQLRLQAQITAAAAAPVRSRSADRMAAAQTMLSLGLATEAMGVLSLVAAEDPAAAATAEHAGLSAIAALLAGRSAEAMALDDGRLDGTDEMTLWRGVRDAMRDTDPGAGQDLPRLLPLADAYPAALRDRLRPLIVEAAIATGQDDLVKAALASDDPSLAYARAMLRERAGDTDAALAMLDTVSVGRDQLAQVRAGARAAELRLRTGAITPAQAADTTERLAAAWRGDARESRLRLRAAELRTMAGAFRPALELLRDTERLFPEQQSVVRSAMAAVFAAMLAHPQAVPPLDLVTMASEFVGLLPVGTGDGVPALLADKLVALDLPARAAPVLGQLMAAAAPGPVRAGIGLRLAQLEFEAGTLPAAQAALDGSAVPDLPAMLTEQRGLVQARLTSARGDLAGAVTGLQALGTVAADDLRATLLERAADWRGSLLALSDLAGRVVPATGPLTEVMQDIVLRQATSAVQANDAAVLADLRRRHGPRLAGARADLFRVLTADPVRSPSDLPRTATELALARTLPERLDRVAAAR